MIGRQTRIGPLFIVLALALLLSPRVAAQQVAREELGVRITTVDATGFPTVRVRVLTTGPGSARVSDTSRLLLRENGVPIPEATTSGVAVGVDLVFVIDANVDFLLVDDGSGLTRRDKVAATIARFADGAMNDTGLDRISVIAPDAARLEPVFLVQDAAQPGELSAPVAAWDAAPPADQPLRATPLPAMLTAAIDHLAAQEGDGRFRAVLLYSDGARLDGQLDAPALAAASQAATGALSSSGCAASCTRKTGSSRAASGAMTEMRSSPVSFMAPSAKRAMVAATLSRRVRPLPSSTSRKSTLASMTKTRSTPTATPEVVASGMGTPFSRSSRREVSLTRALPGPVVSTRTRTVGKPVASTVVMRTPSSSRATCCAATRGDRRRARAKTMKSGPMRVCRPIICFLSARRLVLYQHNFRGRE